MSPEALHEELVELARAAGFEVRRASGGSAFDRDLPISSGVCRVRDTVWVVLTPGEPFSEQNAVLASALREHAASLLETRYLAPALREWLGV
jgi:hypothetical protein